MCLHYFFFPLVVPLMATRLSFPAFHSIYRLSQKPFQITDINLHTDLARFFSTKTHSFFFSSFDYFGFYFLATARFLCVNSTNSSYKLLASF